MSAVKPLKKIILLDSCSYFRLGASFRPILFKLEGDPEYELKVLADLDKEYSKNARLKTKYWWAGTSEFVEEREANRFVPSPRRVNAVRLAFSYINQYAIDNNISASLIDKRVLSVGHAMSGIVVTDDLAMQSLAETFNISWINTLGLLKLMYERGKATIEDIDSIIEYWKYEKDFPTSFHTIKDWRATLCH